MAITGAGTEQNPYIVHDYTELKTACYDNNIYVELANDIDCNTYGEDFEWKTVYLGNNSDLDLKGHIIKNFKVFEGTSNDSFVFRTDNFSKIHNGKILNAYLARSQGFNKLSGSTESRWAYLEKLSMSINTGVGVDRNRIFENLDINACAIYIEGAIGLTSNGDNCYFNPYSPDYPIRNCDIYVNHPNTNKEGHIFRATSSGKLVKNCRIRGVFNFKSAMYMDFAHFCGTQNCVWDLTSINAQSLGTNPNTDTGIVNIDKLPSGFNTSGAIAATSQEIINGDALRAKGFEVLNVTA